MTLQPHGGKLVERFEPNFTTDHITKEIEIDAIALSDLELIGIGAYSPLEGFLTKADYETVVEQMRLANGTVWSIPITLPVNEAVATTVEIGNEAKLVYGGEVYGVITVADIFTPDKEVEATNVYGTADRAHPGVAKLFERPNTYVGGDVKLLKKRLLQKNETGWLEVFWQRL